MMGAAHTVHGSPHCVGSPHCAAHTVHGLQVEQLEARVVAAVSSVSHELDACAAGSYRRGAASCGDIDV